MCDFSSSDSFFLNLLAGILLKEEATLNTLRNCPGKQCVKERQKKHASLLFYSFAISRIMCWHYLATAKDNRFFLYHHYKIMDFHIFYVSILL